MKDAISLDDIKNDVKQNNNKQVENYQSTKKSLYGISAVEDEQFRNKNKSWSLMTTPFGTFLFVINNALMQ